MNKSFFLLTVVLDAKRKTSFFLLSIKVKFYQTFLCSASTCFVFPNSKIDSKLNNFRSPLYTACIFTMLHAFVEFPKKRRRNYLFVPFRPFLERKKNTTGCSTPYATCWLKGRWEDSRGLRHSWRIFHCLKNPPGILPSSIFISFSFSLLEKNKLIHIASLFYTPPDEFSFSFSKEGK